MNILSIISIILMLLSIAMMFKNKDKQNKIARRSMFFSIILQALSFVIISTFTGLGESFISIILGIIIGLVFGLKSKLESKDNMIFYNGTIFSLIYTIILLINQALLLAIKVYIPFMISIAGIATGMQIGYSLMILSKAKKLKNKLAMCIITVLALLLPLSQIFPSYAEGNEADLYRMLLERAYINDGDFGIKYDTSEYPVKSKEECFTAQYSTAIEQNYYSFSQFIQHKKPDSYKFSKNVWYDGHINYSIIPVQQEIRSYGADMSYVPPDFQLVYQSFDEDYANKANTAEYKAAEENAGQWFATYSTHAHYKYEGKIKGYYITFEYEAYATALEAAKDSDESWELDRALENDSSKGLIEEDVKAFVENVTVGMISRLQSIENGIPSGSSISTEETDQPNSSTSNIEENKNSDSPFKPKPVDPLKAKLIATISAILGSLAVLVNMLNAKIPKATTKNVQNIPQGSTDKNGKIYTKNHGFQNEFYPSIKIKSLEKTIATLNDDLDRYKKNGDKLMTEIVQDELIKSNTELKKWKEDQIIISKVQSRNLEELYQNQVKRWMNRADYLETAENIASTISFASDLALSIASVGSSTAATQAAKSLYRTIEVLKYSKEGVTVLAEGTDGLLRGKNLSSVIAEQGAKKVISMAVDKEFGNFKDLYEVDENLSKSLQRLVAAAESSLGNIIGGEAQDMGIIENFGKTFK